MTAAITTKPAASSVEGATQPDILPPSPPSLRPAATPTKPWINKWVLFALAVLYVICPLDGDFIPVAGWIDDVLVMAMGIKALLDQRS